MDSKKITRLWSVSLFAINIATLIAVFANIAGVGLPVIVKGIILAVDIVGLPVVIYTTYKKFMENKYLNKYNKKEIRK